LGIERKVIEGKKMKCKMLLFSLFLYSQLFSNLKKDIVYSFLSTVFNYYIEIYIDTYDFVGDESLPLAAAGLTLCSSLIFCADDYNNLFNSKEDTSKIYSFTNCFTNCALAGYTMSVFFTDNSNDWKKKLLLGSAMGLFTFRTCLNGALFVNQMKKDNNIKE